VHTWRATMICWLENETLSMFLLLFLVAKLNCDLEVACKVISKSFQVHLTLKVVHVCVLTL